jgi:tetratricopeptide (TPR) repeat protein
MTSTLDRHWQRAQRYIADNQIAAAKATLESIVSHAPHRSDARMLLASVMLSEGTIRNAAEQAVIASKNLPNHAQPVSTVAHALLRIGETNAARDALLRFNASTTRDGPLLMALAHAFQALGDHPKALALMDATKAVGFDTPDVRYFRSLELQFNGRLDEAREELAACLRLGPTYGRASLAFVRMRKQTLESNHLDYVLEHLKSVPNGTEDHASFKFAEFKILEDLGRYDEAFPAMQVANDIMYARMEHDIDKERRTIDALIEKTPADFANIAGVEQPAPTPIFIIGLPRSGTTLLDRILDNHSQVMSTGERIEFPRQVRWAVDVRGQEMLDEKMISRIDQIDFAEVGRRYLERTRWRAKGRRFFLDKLPPNYLLAGLIARALPNAPILHMVRDPMDVCYSNYKAMFGESFAYSYNIDALAAHYHQYRRLMRHWHETMPGRIFDVNYNALVTDPEPTIQAILDHCGLPHEPGLMDTSRNTTAVDTLSSAQVRQPIHARTIGEWRRYEKQLTPLHTGLSDFL